MNKIQKVFQIFNPTYQQSTPLKSALISDSPIDSEAYGFRNISGNIYTKELPPITQDRMFQICYWLWCWNDMAKWVVNTINNYVIGDGWSVTSDDESINEFLTDWWKVNNMNRFFNNITRELSIYGEIYITKHVQSFTSKTYLGYIEPSRVDSVIIDPENAKIKIGIKLKQDSENYYRQYKIITDESLISKKGLVLRNSFTDGYVYYENINNVTNNPRGMSDLFTIADKLDGLEGFHFDLYDRYKLLNSFIWDLLAEGADIKKLKEIEETFKKTAGSVFTHNENITLTAISPTLNSVEADEAARTLRIPILGAFSIPPHFYSDPANTNRATALEMGSPFHRFISERQGIIKGFLEVVVTDVLETANLNSEFKVIAPEVSAKDATAFSQILTNVTNSVISAMMNKIIDLQSARKLYVDAVQKYGYELNIDEITENVEKEQEENDYKDYIVTDNVEDKEDEEVEWAKTNNKNVKLKPSFKPSSTLPLKSKFDNVK
jgi:hypothetical protein